MGEVRYREMRESDYREVVSLWANGSGNGTLMLRKNDSRENFAKYLKTSPGCSFVAIIDGEIAGTIMGGTDQHRSFINHLYVDESAQGLGIGSKLVELSEAALASASDARSYITVRKGNVHGLKWWKARGYESLDHVELLWKDIHPEDGDDKRSATSLLAPRPAPARGWLLQAPDTGNEQHNALRHAIEKRFEEESAGRDDIRLEWVSAAEAVRKASKLDVGELPDFALLWTKDVKTAQMLELMGVRCFNRPDAIRICDDKTLTGMKLLEAGLPQPGFVIVPPQRPESIAGFAEEELGFPMVGKQCDGSFGAEVVLLENEEELGKWLGETDGDLVLQEFVASSTGRDLRVMVIGGEVVASMQRTAVGGEFRANITNGGTGSHHDVTETERDLAIRAARACGCDWAGVDLLFGEDGPLVCEVNSNAHFSGLEKASGVNIAAAYLDYVSHVIG